MTIRGVLTENSDVNAKQDIEPLDGQKVLDRLAQLEISEWSYIDDPKTRHIGPMAQDFRAAFGLGHTNKGISTLDSSGVALAAIKELIEENVSLREDNALLKKRLDSMEQQQVQMQAAMAKFLDSQQAHSILTSTVMN
jgi:hypothetical protein